MELAVHHVMGRLRRRGHKLKSMQTGRGRKAESWVVSGGAVLNGVNELTAFARGVGAIDAEDSITRFADTPEPVKEPAVDKTAPEPIAHPDAPKAAERFAQTLAGLTFDLSFNGQRDIWNEAIRTAPRIRETNAYRSWRGRNVDRIAVEHFGL